ncbi:MAG TPA: hypothetical protein VK604_26035, partial [Bryobacteraceae bacterium]|nr:hypothetical protein [Bryobacteraceae bacterium]
NIRSPRDYDTVPRLYFWLSHLLWLFPWSVYIPAIAKLSFKPAGRAGRTRLLALCWISFVMVFFTFSTTQEYYSMPIYPALALLIGCGMATENSWTRWGTRVLCVIAGCLTVTLISILIMVRGLPAVGDIASALSSNPAAYKLSLGHMQDLTIASFAYLRLPLVVAVIAFGAGCLGMLLARGRRAYLATVLMMVIFFHAARLALVVFDPYMSSRPLAEALRKAPAGKLIVNHHYYEFSSVFFYANCTAFLLNGRFNNLVYGSYAPGSADVFLDDAKFKRIWKEPQRYYLVADRPQLAKIEAVVPRADLKLVAASGGKFLFSNQPVP